MFVLHATPAEITHLVQWIADVINVFNLHVWQSSALFSVHYVLVRRECKLAVRTISKEARSSVVELVKQEITHVPL